MLYILYEKENEVRKFSEYSNSFCEKLETVN